MCRYTGKNSPHAAPPSSSSSLYKTHVQNHPAVSINENKNMKKNNNKNKTRFERGDDVDSLNKPDKMFNITKSKSPNMTQNGELKSPGSPRVDIIKPNVSTIKRTPKPHIPKAIKPNISVEKLHNSKKDIKIDSGTTIDDKFISTSKNRNIANEIEEFFPILNDAELKALIDLTDIDHDIDIIERTDHDDGHNESDDDLMDSGFNHIENINKSSIKEFQEQEDSCSDYLSRFNDISQDFDLNASYEESYDKLNQKLLKCTESKIDGY
jgi:hypothetical protein